MFGTEGIPLAYAQFGTFGPLAADQSVVEQAASQSLIVQAGVPFPETAEGTASFGANGSVSPAANTVLNSATPFAEAIPAAPSVSTLPGSEYPYPTQVIPHPLDLSKAIATDDHNIKMLEPDAVEPTMLNLYELAGSRYTVYRREENGITYLPGDGDQFGWLSFEAPNYLHSNRQSGFTTNMNIHLLSGPRSVDLPPRLYDFELGYQRRKSLSDRFSYDCSAMVGIYSDFEDSARDGVRFPAHAVGMFHPGPRADWVFGIDYLDRDDIQLLPVFGMVWHDPDRPQLRYELVFPRPRVDWTLSEQSRLYCSGLLGGGTWDIEFPDERNDVMTYRDYRLAFGVENTDEDGSLNSWEIGWVFSRKLEFRESPDEMGFGDAFMIRYVARK